MSTTNPMRGATLITGAGRGIGRATALMLAERGHPLLLLSKSAEMLAETAAACRVHVPTRERVVDLSRPECVDDLDALIVGTELKAVVNNAGVGDWAPIDQLSVTSWDTQINTNLRGPFLVVQRTLDHFKRSGRGLFVNVGSDSSLVGKKERAAYNASKFGLVGLTTCMRAEFSGTDIHTALILAGSTDTHFRGKAPGMRPGSMSASSVARAITFTIEQYPDFGVGELSLFPVGSGAEGPRSVV
jgi:NAD(P)-dependent dehydrogenase (short-subunit alcohol dehydrogenase family)